jgi:hypothetical protein
MTEFDELIAVLKEQNALLEQISSDLDDVLEATRSLLSIALANDSANPPAGGASA